MATGLARALEAAPGGYETEAGHLRTCVSPAAADRARAKGGAQDPVAHSFKRCVQELRKPLQQEPGITRDLPPCSGFDTDLLQQYINSS